MQDCVLVWVMSAFLQDCNDGDLRWRSRTVLRWPEGDHTCPDLNQTQPCVNMTCLKYSYVYSGTVTNVHTSQFTDCQKSVLSTLWSAGSEFVCVCVEDWSSCQLSENAVCGRGIKTRLLNCVRSDGKLVELSMCKEVTVLFLLEFFHNKSSNRNLAILLFSSLF